MKFDDSLDELGVLESCSVVYELDRKDYSENLIDLLDSFAILIEEVPLCIKRFLKENSDWNYHERYFLILFLYRSGLSASEIKEVLKVILNAKRLYHCCGVIKNGYRPTSKEKARRETQVENIVENDYYLTCGQIMFYGFCNPLCTIHDVLYHIS
jgi:hypothetical protein